MPSSSLRKVLLVIALIAGAALAIVAGNYVGHELAHQREQAQMAERVSGMNTGESSALRAGDPFPVVSLVTPPDASGGTTRVSSSDLVAGRAALVFFLSTDCDPCTKAVRRWSQSAAEVPSSVLLFGIIDQPPAVRDAFVAENAVSFLVLSDSDDTFGHEYDVGVYPTIVGVDANGTMVFVQHGVDEGLTPGVALEMLHAGIEAGD